MMVNSSQFPKVNFQNEKLNVSLKCLLQQFKISSIDTLAYILKSKLRSIVLIFILFYYNSSEVKD